MMVETIPVGEYQANCFVAWGKAKQAIIIDPGDDAADILSFIKTHDLSIASYLLTHGHMDHICALAQLYESVPAPVGIHSTDLKWAFDNNMPSPFYPIPKRPKEIARILADGQEWIDGGLKFKVIATPGHTPGCVCFYFEEEHILFTGDTLFAGSIGRTDLPGGDSKVMGKSLSILAKLPPETKVYSGHGPSTSIAFEKKNNFYMLRQEHLHE